MSDKVAELLADLRPTDARREKLRETLDRMRSRSNRFSDVPDFSVDVPRRTVFGNSVEELGYKATRVTCMSTVTRFTTLENPSQDIHCTKKILEMLKGQVLMNCSRSDRR